MQFSVSDRRYRFTNFDEYDKDFNELCSDKDSLDVLIESLDNGFDYLYRTGDSLDMKLKLETGFGSAYMLLCVEKEEKNVRVITYNGVETFDV